MKKYWINEFCQELHSLKCEDLANIKYKYDIIQCYARWFEDMRGVVESKK